MKNIILASASLLALLSAAPAIAQDSTVTQTGSANAATVNQTGAGNTTESDVTQYGADNLSTVTQTADGAKSEINQGGEGLFWPTTGEIHQAFGAEANVVQHAASSAQIDQIKVDGRPDRDVDANITQGAGSAGSSATIYQHVSNTALATIDQQGANNTSNVRHYQSNHNSYNSQSGDRNKSDILVGGSFNQETVLQSGDDNTSLVNVFGNSNVAYINQIGNWNGSSLSEIGSNSNVTVVQEGDRNTSQVAAGWRSTDYVSQSGNDNYSEINQGSQFAVNATVTQSGNGAVSKITQNGTGWNVNSNSNATVNQSADANSYITQNGVNHAALVTQSGDSTSTLTQNDSGQSATVWKTADSSTSTILQGGDANFASVSQHTDGTVSSVTQNGNSNVAYVTQ